MKKLLMLLLVSALIFTTNISEAKANAVTIVSQDTVHLSNGMYIETIIVEERSNSTFATTNTKTASKIAYIKNSSNTTIATFKITGTFTYDGSTAQCTAASHSSTINNSAWTFTFKSANRLTNRAIGQYAIQCTQNGTVVQTISDTITLTCSPNGTLS